MMYRDWAMKDALHPLAWCIILNPHLGWYTWRFSLSRFGIHLLNWRLRHSMYCLRSNSGGVGRSLLGKTQIIG
jgi:hypothetical protein